MSPSTRRVRSAAAAATWKSGVPSEYEIIGVVADERFRGLEQPGEPAVYVSSAQFPLTDPVVLVRTNGDPSAIASDVRAAVHRAEPRAAFEHPAALSEILARQLAPRTITAGTVTAFSSAALALAIVGLYGLLSMIVASRRHEIGIRLTLGASPRIVARAIVFESAAVTAAGTAVGCLLALVAGRALQGWLFGVDARNLPLIAAVTSALLAVSVLAAVVPARHAAAIDPASSLRGS